MVAACWTYAPSFDGVFVLDDVRAIVRNTTIQTLWPPSVPLSPPPESTVSGRPLANLSFAINRAFASPASLASLAWSYHAGNLLIHIGAALALFGVVRRTLLSERLRPTFNDSAASVGFAVALVWVVHPLNTESVTYIVQRVESLMGLFFLLTLYCAIRAADGIPVASIFRVKAVVRRSWWTGGAIASCALGMGTKEVMVGAPVVVALWDWLFLPRRRPRWGLAAATASTWIVLALLVFNERRAPSVELGAGMVWRYLLTQAEVIAHYLRLSFVPTPLVFLYTWPLASSVVAVAVPAALVCALLALTVFGLVKRHPAALAGAAFFIVLAPTSSVLPIVTEVAAEHRMYLPLAAVIALVLSWGQISILDIRKSRGSGSDPSSPGSGSDPSARGSGSDPRVAVLAIFLAIVLGIETRSRNRDYWSEEQLWADTVAKQPANERARVAYGSVLGNNRKVAEAEAQFQAAVDLNEADPIAQSRLGSALAAQGKLDSAIPHLERALALRPDDVEAHRSLGQIYAMRREDARAVPHLSRAVDAMPDDPALVSRLAAILAGSPDPMVRDPQRAVALAERAASLTRRQEPLVLSILAVALAGAGRLPEATATAREGVPLAVAQGNQALAAELRRMADGKW